MIKVLIEKQPDLTTPKRGTDRSSGYDVVATSDPVIVGKEIVLTNSETGGQVKAYRSIDYIEYRTNIKVAPQGDIDLLAMGRSSVTKQNLILKNCVGLIDNDYRNFVAARFHYTIQPEDMIFFDVQSENGQDIKVVAAAINPDKIYKKGDKIFQFKATPLIELEFVEVDKLDETQRGEGGWGSTGR